MGMRRKSDLPQKNLPRLRAPFHLAQRNGRGTGRACAIARSAAAAKHAAAKDGIGIMTRPGSAGYRSNAISQRFSLITPRRIWSSSIDSNNALKLPSPKPSSPLRWMNSKKIGPTTVFEKRCSRHLV